ncbi:10928_t:CDS:10 [Entrophospora sp. SA101]|nr:10928_t:CDS:10 [Entrophospora sp. SA101]
MAPSNAKKFFAEVAMIAISQVLLYYTVKYVVKSLDPLKDKKKESKAKSDKVLSKLGLKDLKLSEYEEIILSEVIFPEDISVNFKKIGGLDPIIQNLRESVIFPLTYPELFSSSSGLLGAPKGVLLYGPPGCGKTMLAKALASESKATFINLHVSTLTDKWFGESNKLVSAVFSVAKKLQPCIVFIDEIDAFLRERRSNDHEVTDENIRIIILGATNRPNDIDNAILRRMPKRFSVQLPNEEQRRNILEIMLHDQKLEENFDFDQLVAKTAGFSGSDLKELCRNAAMFPVREYMRNHSSPDGDLDDVDPKNIDIRPLSISDFFIGETDSGNQLKNSSTLSDFIYLLNPSSSANLEPEQLD